MPEVRPKAKCVLRLQGPAHSLVRGGVGIVGIVAVQHDLCERSPDLDGDLSVPRVGVRVDLRNEELAGIGARLKLLQDLVFDLELADRGLQFADVEVAVSASNRLDLQGAGDLDHGVAPEIKNGPAGAKMNERDCGHEARMKDQNICGRSCGTELPGAVLRRLGRRLAEVPFELVFDLLGDTPP